MRYARRRDRLGAPSLPRIVAHALPRLCPWWRATWSEPISPAPAAELAPRPGSGRRVRPGRGAIPFRDGSFDVVTKHLLFHELRRRSVPLDRLRRWRASSPRADGLVVVWHLQTGDVPELDGPSGNSFRSTFHEPYYLPLLEDATSAGYLERRVLDPVATWAGVLCQSVFSLFRKPTAPLRSPRGPESMPNACRISAEHRTRHMRSWTTAGRKIVFMTIAVICLIVGLVTRRRR